MGCSSSDSESEGGSKVSNVSVVTQLLGNPEDAPGELPKLGWLDNIN